MLSKKNQESNIIVNKNNNNSTPDKSFQEQTSFNQNLYSNS